MYRQLLIYWAAMYKWVNLRTGATYMHATQFYLARPLR